MKYTASLVVGATAVSLGVSPMHKGATANEYRETIVQTSSGVAIINIGGELRAVTQEELEDLADIKANEAARKEAIRPIDELWNELGL